MRLLKWKNISFGILFILFELAGSGSSEKMFHASDVFQVVQASFQEDEKTPNHFLKSLIFLALL